MSEFDYKGRARKTRIDKYDGGLVFYFFCDASGMSSISKFDFDFDL